MAMNDVLQVHRASAIGDTFFNNLDGEMGFLIS